MDNRPIGVFDSGIGGLTALKALRKLLPNEEIVYFGDSGRMPYGGRPLGELLKIALQDTAFLIDKNVKALLAACGTTDSNAMPYLKDKLSEPIFGVILPAAAAAAAATKTGRIGVISTEATTRSNAFGNALHNIDPYFHVITRGCPLIAPLTEHGHIDKNDPVLRDALGEYLRDIINEDVDTLILGCTHYPLVAAAISDIMGEETVLIDSGAQSAVALAKHLSENGMLSDGLSPGRVTYYTSGDTKKFASVAEIFLGESIASSVLGVTPFSL